MSSTLEILKNEVDFVISSNETYENQLQIETINQLYSKVSVFDFCIRFTCSFIVNIIQLLYITQLKILFFCM
jgi:hypothetical protein